MLNPLFRTHCTEHMWNNIIDKVSTLGHRGSEFSMFLIDMPKFGSGAQEHDAIILGMPFTHDMITSQSTSAALAQIPVA